MWLLLAASSLFIYALTDIIGKKLVDDGDRYAPIRIYVPVLIIEFLVSLALYASGAGESGSAPWQLALEYPLIPIALSSLALSELLYLLSLRCIALSVQEAVASLSGIVYFAGIVLVNAFSGLIASVRNMFVPIRLIPIIVVCLFIALLPNTEIIADKALRRHLFERNSSRRQIVIGLVIVGLALICDAVYSLCTTVVLESDEIGAVDFLMTAYFSAVFPIILFSCLLLKKGKAPVHPFSGRKALLLLYIMLFVLNRLLCFLASEIDAVKTGIVYIAYPIIPILGAKLLLKEKYTWRQNLCIWAITLAAIVFCAADYIA